VRPCAMRASVTRAGGLRRWGVRRRFEGVLRIVDGRDGEPVEVDPGRRTPLRVLAHTRPGDGATALRVLLVADVLVRTAETRHGQVLLAVVGPADPALETAASALGIRPAVARGDSVRETEEALAGRARVHVTATGADPVGPRLEVGPVRPREVPDGADGFAARLALLGLDRRAPAELTPPVLEAAEARLRRWRRTVARWAQSPSRPMCAGYAERLRAALAADLDTAAFLACLEGLAADSALPEGSRFETFAHADRVLALELTREVGGVRS
jgi:hypothetical protein